MTTQGPQGNTGLESLLQAQRLGAGGGGKYAPAPGIFAGIIPDIEGMQGGLNFKSAAIRFDNMIIAAVPFGNPSGYGMKTHSILAKIMEDLQKISEEGHRMLAQNVQSSGSFMNGSGGFSSASSGAPATQGGDIALG